jgi:hypothetical protein
VAVGRPGGITTKFSGQGGFGFRELGVVVLLRIVEGRVLWARMTGPIDRLGEAVVMWLNDDVGCEWLTNLAAWMVLRLPREGLLWGWAVGVSVMGLVIAGRIVRIKVGRTSMTEGPPRGVVA